MKYTREKRKGLDRLGKKIFLNNYHKWLEQERLKDKKKLKEKTVTLANFYLAKGKCPYCKKGYEVKETDGVIQRICTKHGLLAVKKKEWRIWSNEKKINKNNKGESK